MSGKEDKIAPGFPLGERHRDDVRANSGRPLNDLTLSDVLAGNAVEADVAISADTLMMQARFAEEAGYHEVARNLTRAAEMTRIPNEELLRLYESLRPGRSTYDQLLSLCQWVTSEYDAEHTGAYIREAADAYRDTGLLKVDDL